MSTTQHRFGRLLAALLAVTLLASACGSDDAATTTDDTTTTTEAMEEETPDTTEAMEEETSDTTEAMVEEIAMISDECNIPNPEDEIEVDVIGWEFPVLTQYAEELLDCEEGNYTVNYQFLDSGPAREQMLTDAATGSPTFELYQGSNSHLAALVAADAIMPLDDLVEKYSELFDFDAIPQAQWDAASFNGSIYSIPMVSNVQYQFYNKPKLEELGVSVPTNFTEALEACQALKAAGQDAGYVYHVKPEDTWALRIEFHSILGAFGEFALDNETGQPNIATENAAKAAAHIKQFAEECSGDAARSYGTSDIQAGFQSGELLLGHTWASRSAAMDDAESSTVVGDIFFAPALTADGGTIRASSAYIDGWAIPAGTDPELIEPLFLLMGAASDAESQTAAAAFNAVTRDGSESADGAILRATDAFVLTAAEGRGKDQTHPGAPIMDAKIAEAMDAIVNQGADIDASLLTAQDAYIEEATAQGILS